MKIAGVSAYNSYNKANNVSFGRFRDENAEAEIKKALIKKPEQSIYMQEANDQKFQTLKDCCFVDIYTDEEDGGKIRVKYNEKMINGKNGERNLDIFMTFFDDLRNYVNIAALYSHINVMTNAILPGQDLKKPDEGMSDIDRAVLQREEDRINWLNNYV